MDASGGLDVGARHPVAGRGGVVGLRATEPAARVRTGEVTAVEVVRAHLAHLDEVEPRVGAFRVVRREAALAEAAADDAAHLGIAAAGLQPRSRTHARVGRLVRAARLIRPGTAERFRERMAAFFGAEALDLLLTPVTTGPALPARPWHGAARRDAAGGLPLAVQFAGPPGAERRLLWLAGELARRQPWRRYAPVFDPVGAPSPAPV